MINELQSIETINLKKANYFIDARDNYDLFVFDYGHIKCDISNYYTSYNSTQIRPFFSIHWVIKGKGSLVLNNIIYEVNPNSIFVIPPDIPEQHYPDKNDPWEFYWVNFSGAKAFDLCKRAGFLLANPVYSFDADNYIELLDELMTFNNHRSSQDLLCLSQLYKLLSIIIDDRNKSELKPFKNKNMHILNAMLYIDTHLNSCDLSLKDVSTYLNLNPSYFSRIFKSEMGICFSHYLTMSRIQKAENLLENSDYYINQIAAMVGYDNPFYFSREFKRCIGMSPKLYKINFGLT
jgi:AraC-like DNA-binding protein